MGRRKVTVSCITARRMPFTQTSAGPNKGITGSDTQTGRQRVKFEEAQLIKHAIIFP